MRVKVGNSLSRSAELRYGVPQGSVLGPLLFSIYINDLPLVLKICKCIMYADDVILYFSGKTKAEVEEKIQADFNAIAEWADLNGMEISLSKTKTMLFCPPRMAKPEKLRIGLGDAYLELAWPVITTVMTNNNL